MKIVNEILAMFPVKGKAIMSDLMKKIELKETNMDDHPLEVILKLWIQLVFFYIQPTWASLPKLKVAKTSDTKTTKSCKKSKKVVLSKVKLQIVEKHSV